MKQQIIDSIMQGMLPYLDNAQLRKLEEVVNHSFYGCEITLKKKSKRKIVKNY